MRQVTWQELSSVLLEYEDKSNYDTLKTFAARYYPTATHVEEHPLANTMTYITFRPTT
jgi:hypothetical protein